MGTKSGAHGTEFTSPGGGRLVGRRLSAAGRDNGGEQHKWRRSRK